MNGTGFSAVEPGMKCLMIGAKPNASQDSLYLNQPVH